MIREITLSVLAALCLGAIGPGLAAQQAPRSLEVQPAPRSPHAIPTPRSPDDPAARRSQGTPQVRVTARMVVVDRAALTRAGVGYRVMGHDRVRVGRAATGSRRGGGARLRAGVYGVAAFLDVVRESRWIRSESSQQLLVLSGSEGRLASQSLAVGRFAARTRGPELVVAPTVEPDGTVRLRVSTRLEDTVRYGWGWEADGSPAAVETEVVVPAGEEVLLASSSSVERTRDAGLLYWGDAEAGLEVLVAVTADPIR